MRRDFLAHLGGLRGLAIVLVILFHLNATVFPQGYLGVDVFLVISGYLLFRNRLRQNGLMSANETLLFAWRKIQRIIAPMCIIILLTLGAGILFLLADGERLSCRLGETSCLGYANVLLSRVMADYFAPAAEYTPLLHLWYLAVTLQVYLLFTVGNYALQRLPKAAIISILTLIGLGSLVLRYSFPLHEWLEAHLFPTWEQSSDVSYYATLPRLWEILAGGAICFLPSIHKKIWATLVSSFGLLGIIIFSFNDIIPGGGIIGNLPSTFIVVFCTMMTIRYMPEGHLNKALANKPLLWLGGISFSVYLVHMPVIVFTRLWNYGVLNWTNQCLIIMAVIVLGWGFWWCIEKRRIPWWLIILLWGSTYVVSRTGRKMDGFKQYMPYTNSSSSVKVELPKYTDWQMCQDPVLCADWDNKIVPRLNIFKYMGAAVPRNIKAPFLLAGDPAQEPTFVLIGDSFGMHSYPGLDYVMKKEGISGIYMALNIYPFHNMVVKNPDASYNFNPEKESSIIKWLCRHSQLKYVIIAQRWEQKDQMAKARKMDFEKSLREFIQPLRDAGKRIILVGPTPIFAGVSPAIRKISALRGDIISNFSIICTLKCYNETNKYVFPVLRKLEKEGIVSLLDPIGMLQSGNVFKAIDDNGNMLMIDSDGHFSVEGSKKLMITILPQLRKALQISPSQK